MADSPEAPAGAAIVARGRRRGGGRGRVCFYVPYLYPVVSDGAIPFAGGAEVQQWLMSLGLRQEGFEISIVTCDYGQRDRIVRQGIELIRAYRPAAGLPVLRFFHPRLSLAVRALARADADLYFVQGAGLAAGVAYDVARLRGAKFVFMAAHDLDTVRALPLLEIGRDRWWYRRALRGADAVIAQTEFQRTNLRDQFGVDGEVVANPVEVPERAVDAGQEGTVLWLATYKAAKRPEWFTELALRLPRLRFVMAGVIPVPPLTHEAWDAAVAAARSCPNLEVRGYVERAKLGEVFGAASLFVHTSPAEGFPNTVLEAWASGLPSVTAVNPDGVVTRERLGEVVTEFPQLVAAVERWMADPEARRATGGRARTYCAAHHDPARVRARLGRIVDRVLAG